MPRPRIIEDACFILDLETGDMCDFQMMPEITDAKSVNWNQIEIIGRSHPILGYNNSGPRTFSFTLTFFAHPSKVGDTTSQGDIVKRIKFLLSLTYPDLSGGIKPPHKCALKLGNMVYWDVVAQDINVNYHPLWKNNLPVYADVSCTFIEAEDNPISYSMVRG